MSLCPFFFYNVVALLLMGEWFSFHLNITTALGNGALFLYSSNLSLPLIKRISVAFITISCHHFVSVRLGIRKTTILLFSYHSRYPLSNHFPISRPYGGLQKFTAPHSDVSPSTLWLGGQGSCVNLNSLSSNSYSAFGVFQFNRCELKCIFDIIMPPL